MKTDKRKQLLFIVFMVILAFVVYSSSDSLIAKDDTLSAKPVAFVNVNVIPMDRERVLKNQTVIIKAGHIVAVGPCGEVEIPEGTLRIDGKNKYLLPGLADMHLHAWNTDALLLLIANGVTTVRQMAGSPRTLEWRTKIALGELIGPNVYTAGPIIEGEPPPELKMVIPVYGKKLVATAAEAATAVARHKAAGYDFIKVYNNIPLDAYNGLVAAAKAHGLRVAGHVPFPVGLDGAFESGQRTIEHLRGYIWKLVPKDAPEQPSPVFRDRSVAWQYAEVSRMAALAQATVEAGVFNCPTLMVARYNLAPKEVRDRYRSRPFGVYLPPPAPPPKPGSKKRASWWDAFTEEDFKAVARGYAKREALVRALRDEGAKILSGTDMAPAGFALHLELQNLVDAGLTPYETLVTATRNPAEALGQPDMFGTVAVSKRADLIMISANPIDDIANASRLCGVMVSGRWYPKKELDRFLEEVRPIGKQDLSRRVSVEGAISGIGNPAHIGIRLTQETFAGEAGVYVTIPGGGLEVVGSRKGPRMLRYRYCCASSHDESDYCDDSKHDPSYYKALRIYGGTLESKGGKRKVVWPTGSTWEIYSKDTYDLVDSGKLAAVVICEED